VEFKLIEISFFGFGSSCALDAVPNKKKAKVKKIAE
jgi:hypothetical protein